MSILLTQRELERFTKWIIARDLKCCPAERISDCAIRVVEKHQQDNTHKLGIPYIEFVLNNGRCRFQYPINELYEETYGAGAAMQAGLPEPENLKAGETRIKKCAACYETNAFFKPRTGRRKLARRGRASSSDSAG